MMGKVLIAGGSGLVGKALVQLLKDKGYKMNILSTRKGYKQDNVAVYYWNPEEFEIDRLALQGVDCIINLAGATVDHKWTTAYKQQIFDSRTRTAETIFRALSKAESHGVKSYISSSGVNYYPNSLDRVFKEQDENGNGFLAQVCQHWELGADKMTQLGIRVVKLRIGMVLSRNGGALKKLEGLTNLAMNAPIGSGKQWISWIHIDDLCGVISHAIDNESIRGVYNTVAPHPVSNKEFTKELARALKRPVLLPSVPEFAVKALYGEMASIVLEGQNCSSHKIQNAGFKFQYPDLEKAFEKLF